MLLCKPERNVGQILVTILSCVVIFIATACMIVTVDVYKWAFELLLLFSVTVGMLVAYRYSMTEMEYRVGDENFSVARIVGRKRTVACSLSLSTAICLVTKSEYTAKVKSHELPYINKKINLNQNIKTASYVYVCEFNGKTIAIEFEPNELFVNGMLAEMEKCKKDDDKDK